MTRQHTYFIGYDARESFAAGVAAYSILRRSTVPPTIYMLEHRTLRKAGLFDRPWSIDCEGQYFDGRDHKPFSTEFSHSRFLVFRLAQMLKLTGPCMFVDCDWLFLDDPAALMDEQAERGDKIGVVSRERKVDENSIKMDGMVQQNYARKLWSAMFTFMPDMGFCSEFTSAVVNNYTGRELHSFLGLGEEEFWQIDPRWHYIPSLDPKCDDPKGIHYSEFSPWLNMDRINDARPEFEAWMEEAAAYLQFAGNSGSLECWQDLGVNLEAYGVDLS